MATRTSLVVDIQIACDDVGIPAMHQIETWVTRAVEDSGETLPGRPELSVRLVDKEEMRSLNRDFRQKDKVTNVLSFPAGGIAGLPVEAAPLLGDIVICAAVVSEEAAQQGKSTDDHWAHMLVHGTLHLLGYDHQSEADAAAMEGLEARILSAHGISDPYVKSR